MHLEMNNSFLQHQYLCLMSFASVQMYEQISYENLGRFSTSKIEENLTY